MDGLWDYKGLFWDDINKQYYRWYDLELLMKEREIKSKKELSNEPVEKF